MKKRNDMKDRAHFYRLWPHKKQETFEIDCEMQIFHFAGYIELY